MKTFKLNELCLLLITSCASKWVRVIDKDYGFVPSGYKALPYHMMTKF